MLAELKFALRSLRKSPGFTAVALLTLALALGANTAVFSLVHAALFRPMVDRAPHELVSVYTATRGAERGFRRFSYAEFERIAAFRDAFAGVAAMSVARVGVGTSPSETLQRSLVHLTSANYFSLLGVQPAHGRFFTAKEGTPRADVPVLVASHAFWQRHGGRPDFIGRLVWVNGRACTVIGITPPDFGGLSALMAPDFWLPLGLYGHIGSAASRASGHTDLLRPDNHTLLLTARLAPGLDRDSASLRLPALAADLATLIPANAPETLPRELLIAPPSRFAVGPRPTGTAELFMLAGPLVFMAASVLLIACLNLANMFLARGAARTREIAVRLALGASRWAVIRQLLLEGLLLALGGGLLGLGVSVWGNHGLLASLGSALRSVEDSALNLRPGLEPDVLGFTLLACTGAALLFSLVPALRASRRDVVPDLKSQGDISGDRWNRFFAGRHLLVMAQIALSIVLLFSAGLFLRGALEARHIPLGFTPERSLVSMLDFALRPADPAAVRRSLDAVRTGIAAVPGVSHVAFSTQPPMSNGETVRRVLPAGTPPDSETLPALFSGTSDGYFAALGIPLLRGRDFSSSETWDESAPPVAIIDASLARRLFPAGDALGQRLRFGGPAANAEEMEIIGIIGEHRQEFLDPQPDYRIYVPLARALGGLVYAHTAFARPAAAAASTKGIREAMLAAEPGLPLLAHEPFTRFIRRDASLWSAQFGALVFSVFAAIALLLAVLGVYGVKAYAVARRTREIGIRAALGARPADLVSLVLRQAALQIGLAAVLGVGLSLLAGQGFSALLFHVSPADPFALAGAVSVLAAAAFAASLIPARRAARVDPMTALRSE